jgi:hypothetical protein
MTYPLVVDLARDGFPVSVTCAWVPWFNNERLHGALGHLTPSEVEVGKEYRVETQIRTA